jgi:hypothetical protein
MTGNRQPQRRLSRWWALAAIVLFLLAGVAAWRTLRQTRRMEARAATREQASTFKTGDAAAVVI